ncbi:MAG: hypothetical protein DMF82_18625 [Acidobacteria bacterium]|nr:MAG: hypothetical protein DMF82_18625 [Acidobacteriota bacterium]
MTLVVCLAAVMTCGFGACRQQAPPVEEKPEVVATPSPTPEPEPTPVAPETWAAAIEKVEERRGSTGKIDIPPELKHYDDRRRFLALQMADSKEEGFDLPHDQGELVEMIKKRELVEMPALGDDYILYDIGTATREDPLSHYDAATNKDVKLFPDFETYSAYDAQLEEDEKHPGKTGAKARAERELLASFYSDAVGREKLFAEYKAVTDMAYDFRGLSYDLNIPAERTQFQVRLLSFIRPEARETLLKLAHDYHQEFGRRLPISSLVRTQRYQRRMVRNSPNATGVDMAPHTTGMAFDISYKFMAPDEQNFVMKEVAELEDDGKVESLRERNNSFHIYTYADGHRPDEDVVTGFLPEVEAAHPNSVPRKAKAASHRTSTGRRASRRSGLASRAH